MNRIYYLTLLLFFGAMFFACATAPKDQNNTRVNLPDTDTTAVSE